GLNSPFMKSNQVAERVRASIEEGMALGKDLVESKKIKEKDLEWIKVKSTPAVFVDGRRFNNPRHKKAWQQILKFHAPKKKQPKTAQSKPAPSDKTVSKQGKKKK
ncbi:unnamed protein product, partial [marine sediment metagenome]